MPGTISRKMSGARMVDSIGGIDIVSSMRIMLAAFPVFVYGGRRGKLRHKCRLVGDLLFKGRRNTFIVSSDCAGGGAYDHANDVRGGF